MTNWTTQLDNIAEDLIAHFGRLNFEQLNWKPNKDTWSIAENFNHLIIVNESYFPIFESLEQGTYKAPFISKFSFLVSLYGKIVLKAVQPDRKKKMKTFQIWKPSINPIEDDILIKFISHNFVLKEKIMNANLFVEGGTVIASPANGNIVYNLKTTFDIIVSHEKRHLEQAKEVLKQLNNL